MRYLVGELWIGCRPGGGSFRFPSILCSPISAISLLSLADVSARMREAPLGLIQAACDHFGSLRVGGMCIG